MKKFFLLAFLFCLQGCVAQQPFEDATFQEPVFLTVTGVLALNADGTASVVKNNVYQKVFHFDGKRDMVEGWKYTVRLKIDNPQDLKGKNVVTATLIGYGITPEQARENAVEISKLGNL